MYDARPEPEDFMKFPYGREMRDAMTVHFDNVEFDEENPETKGEKRESCTSSN